MPSPVELYVYELETNTTPMQSVGRRIDRVWFTSVVVFDKEVYYEGGIRDTNPGYTHYGRPMQIIGMGETALEKQIFEKYLAEMRRHCTPDNRHILDFNSNSFTVECIWFLTGGSIPSFLEKDLASAWLSTPLRSTIRLTIPSMFRCPLYAGSPLSGATNMGSGVLPLDSFFTSYRAAVAMFTSATCVQCRSMEPVFEVLAREKKKGRDKVEFFRVDVDLILSLQPALLRKYGIISTPTFRFFLDGKMTHELQGINALEIRSQVNILLWQAFPPHPHALLDLPYISSLSTKPILFAQVPVLDTVHDKLVYFIDATPSLENSKRIKDDLAQNVFPWLKRRYVENSEASPDDRIIAAFSQTIRALAANLPVASLFPLLDVWRLAILEPTIAPVTLDPLVEIMTSSSESLSSLPRATLLTLLRLTTNALGSSRSKFTWQLVTNERKRTTLTSVLVPALQHSDRLVRVAAASLVFNVSARLQKGRAAKVRDETGEADWFVLDEEWELQLVRAITEAIAKEGESEDLVHRLTATLAFLIRLSPSYQSQLCPLLRALDVRKMLKGKLAENGKLTARTEIRELVMEVADRLCST